MAVRKAVVVGMDVYGDGRIPDLRYAVEDARRVANALENAGFEVRWLHDVSDRRVVAEVERMAAGLGAADLFVFYFAGHGVLPGESRHLLLCSEAKPELLRYGRGGLWVDELKALTAGFGGHRVLVLDTCREPLTSKPGADGLFRSAIGADVAMRGAVALRNLVEKERGSAQSGGLTILCSCDEEERAQESGALGQGLFSRALVERLAEARREGRELRLDGTLAEMLAERMASLAAANGLQAGQCPWVQSCGSPPVLVEGTEAETSPGGSADRLALLEVRSDPPGASFLVDGGRWKGTTPARLTEIPWGMHHCFGELEGENAEEEFGISSYRHVLDLSFPKTLATRAAPAKRRRPAGEARVVELPGGVDLELVWCPPGEFLMGSPTAEPGRGSDEHQHEVELTCGFWLGKYEVTQRQWQAAMGSNPSHFKEAGTDAPVECVSWDDCQALLEKANAKAGYEGTLRLPTEAEWEYACRAGTTTVFHYGDSLDSSLANFHGKYPFGDGRKGVLREKTTKVGSFKPNAWGLYDMHGDVWEWCQDWYDGDHYGESPRHGPTGPAAGSDRVCRGGCWGSRAGYCRAACRDRNEPGCRYDGLGLRLALSPAVH